MKRKLDLITEENNIIQSNKLLSIPNEIQIQILYECENQKDMYNLGIVCKQMYMIYNSLKYDSNLYKFYQKNYNSVIPQIFEFERVIKKSKYTYIDFNSKYSRCKYCKEKNYNCDFNIQCNICIQNNLQCEKKKIQRRINFNKKSRYCNSLNNHINGSKIIMKHIDEIQNIGKKICERCNNLEYCSTNSIILNSCCDISNCTHSNILNTSLSLFSWYNFTNYYHTHAICEICFNSLEKTTNIPIYNNHIFVTK
jgi:hypothetical protein